MLACPRMNRRKIVKIGGAVIGVLVLVGLGQMAYRMAPRPMPADLAGLRKSSMEILNDKCADCHSGIKALPFYASIPVVGNMVAEDNKQGIRHYDFADASLKEPGLAQTNSEGSPIPIALLNKLERVINNGSMPPLKYELVHWGASLSSSEKAILVKWITEERSLWLKQWGLEKYADSALQPLPDSLPTDAAKVTLGNALYHDTRLSKDNTISCASCHSLDKGGTDNKSFSPGVGGSLGGVNAPTSFNAVFHMRQFWDGRAANLAEQAGGPPLNPVEMASANWDEIIAKLKKDEDFTKKFLAVYPNGYSGESICNAIAEYEKTLITPNSRFDQFLKGDKKAMTAQEQMGYNLFIEYGCATCHSGPAMGGQSFEYMNLKDDYFATKKTTDGDKGLAAYSKQDKDQNRFKVPTLRNVELTYPYLHDGSKETLKEAVAAMMQYQVGKKPPTNEEIDNITSFLRTLTGQLNAKGMGEHISTEMN